MIILRPQWFITDNINQSKMAKEEIPFAPKMAGLVLPIVFILVAIMMNTAWR